MVFNREWDESVRDYVVNRNRTGPPKPASEPGTAAAALTDNDGNVVSAVLADSPIVGIPPSTPITVNLPSPNEPIVMSNGRVNHRWWRFFNELYLRTGGEVDAINTIPTTLLGAGSIDALALAGVAPTIKVDPGPEMSLGSLSLTGAAPTAVVA